MARSEPGSSLTDWRGWIALAWAVGVTLTYAASMLATRLPGIWRRISG